MRNLGGREKLGAFWSGKKNKLMKFFWKRLCWHTKKLNDCELEDLQRNTQSVKICGYIPFPCQCYADILCWSDLLTPWTIHHRFQRDNALQQEWITNLQRSCVHLWRDHSRDISHPHICPLQLLQSPLASSATVLPHRESKIQSTCSMLTLCTMSLWAKHLNLIRELYTGFQGWYKSTNAINKFRAERKHLMRNEIYSWVIKM